MIRAARVRWSERQESGYVLLLVLVACGLFGLIVMALLGMVGTDSKASGVYLKTDEMKRAIDGALQLGVGQIKAVGSSTLKGSADPCVGFPSNSNLLIEGKTVDLSCTAVDGPTDPAPLRLPSAGDGAPVLTFMKDWNILPRISAVVSSGDTAGSDEALQTATNAGGGGAGLIHFGDDPLRVYGSVNVRQSGVTVSRLSTGAGMIVSGGSYREGEPNSAACGSFEWFWGLANPQRTARVSVQDPAGNPQCGPTQEAAVPASTATSVATPAIPTTPGSVPTCAAAGGVVAFDPGAYNASQIAAMNAMFTQGTCDNVTFWFKPGTYFFDAAPDYAVGAVYFNNATTNVVFGEPKGWSATGKAPASVFPEACDRTKPGVSIVLGRTTSIVHGNGAVAICGSPTSVSPPVPVMSQLPAASLPEERWVTEPDTSAAVDWGITAGNGANVAASVPGEVPTGYPTTGKPYDGSETAGRRTVDYTCLTSCLPGIELTGWQTVNHGSDRPLTSATLKIRAATTNVRLAPWVLPPGKNYGDSLTKMFFTRADGATCYAISPNWPVDMANPLSINMLSTNAGPDNCMGKIRNQKDIEDGKIKVYFFLNGNWQPCGLCEPTLTLSVDYAWIETTTQAASSPDPTMSMQIDAANNRTFNVFGRVFLPHTQIDVKWRGSPSVIPNYEMPIFVGDVTARGLLSSNPDEYSRHIGPLASRSLTTASRRVRIRASVSGQLFGSTVVNISDLTPGSATLTPAVQLQTLNWNYCNVPLTPTATC